MADGHGSASCFRSSAGSKFAVKVAEECLKEFAGAVLADEETERRFYEEIFSGKRERQTILRQLTDKILARWYEEVMHDVANAPLPAEIVGEQEKLHVYGTTLIAGLMLPSCLILLQQGDGRCDVIHEDGSIAQPIAWDERCQANITTSLCDADAAVSFRASALDLREDRVTACFMYTDGVEDSYRDTYDDLGGSHCVMGGVHTFSRYLAGRVVSRGDEGLAEFLSEFSAKGSGDDISVAGIIDVEAVGKFTARFARDVRVYALEEELLTLEGEKLSKERKHKALADRLSEAEEHLQEAAPLWEEAVSVRMDENEIARRLARISALAEVLEGSPEHGQVIAEKERLAGMLEVVRRRREGLGEAKAEWLKASQEKIRAGHEFSEYDSGYRELDARIRDLREEISDLRGGRDNDD